MGTMCLGYDDTEWNDDTERYELIGGYFFDWKPKNNFEIIKPKVLNSYLPTFGSLAYFSWGKQLVGHIIELEWDEMPSSQFTQLESLYQDDAETRFTLGQESWIPYNESGWDIYLIDYAVQILDLTGTYWLRLDDAEGHFRKDVKLKLLIVEYFEGEDNGWYLGWEDA